MKRDVSAGPRGAKAQRVAGPPMRDGGRDGRMALKALFGSLAATAETFEVDGEAVLREVAMDLYESLATPIALSCAIKLRYNDIPGLVGAAVNPKNYNDRLQFELDYQAVNFVRKVPWKHADLDPRAAAVKKFKEAELQCRATNARFRSFLSAPEGVSDVVRWGYSLACEKIREVLGNHVDAAEWIRSCRFGPGVFNHPEARGLTSIYDKLQVRPSVTYDFGEMGAKLVMSSPAWARSVTDTEVEGFWPFVDVDDLERVPGNRVGFVPKTATTERAIAVEPLVNVYAQLGLGRMIRNRLRSFADIDLNDQSLNQQLAREGSIRGYLCTVDLSSASDTVAREVVRAMLPEQWFLAMDLSRSKVGKLDDETFLYEKFSSMGNGFTFELETLIFWSLSYAACVISQVPPLVSVYGDDIIAPVPAQPALVELLEFFGFTLNPKKTFFEGVFRESCGKDYYEGTDVRPFLQEEAPQDLRGLFTLANGIRRRAFRAAGSQFGCDQRYRQAYDRVLRQIPRHIRSHVVVPAHAADSDGLVSDWDIAVRSPFLISRWGWEGQHGLRLGAVPLDAPRSTNFEGGVASLLYRAREGLGDDYFPAPPRQGREVVFRLRKGAFWGPWTSLGMWM